MNRDVPQKLWELFFKGSQTFPFNTRSGSSFQPQKEGTKFPPMENHLFSFGNKKRQRSLEVLFLVQKGFCLFGLFQPCISETWKWISVRAVRGSVAFKWFGWREKIFKIWVKCFFRKALFPGIPKTINSMVFPKRPFILVVIYNQQFQGTILLMVSDFQGIFTTPIDVSPPDCDTA